jgi:energy-converting hydrogenase Eha subunit E
MNFADWTGTIGVSLIFIGFFLNLTNKISKDGYLYIVLNLLGGAIACYASILLNYMPFIILEGVWTLVSLISLIRLSLKKQP